MKFVNIESNSLGTPPFELITSSNPNNFMNDDAPTTQQDVRTYERPSCSYNSPRAPNSPTPKGVVQSTHKMDKLVSKICLEKPEREALHATTTLPPLIPRYNPLTKMSFLGSTGEWESGQANDHVPVKTFEPIDKIEEEHDPSPTSTAKSSLSSLKASDVHNTYEFWV